MILLGDPNIPCEDITRIKNLENIKDTEPNSTVLFDFDMKSLHYTSTNDIQSAVVVSSILEVIYAHNLNARYIIVPEALAKEVQDLADHYMFDSKVLVIIEDQNQIEKIAQDHIDGVIYKKLLG